MLSTELRLWPLVITQDNPGEQIEIGDRILELNGTKFLGPSQKALVLKFSCSGMPKYHIIYIDSATMCIYIYIYIYIYMIDTYFMYSNMYQTLQAGKFTQISLADCIPIWPGTVSIMCFLIDFVRSFYAFFQAPTSLTDCRILAG